MGYTDIESALLATCRASSSGTVFTTANSSRGDYAVLDAAGVTLSLVITKAAASEYANRINNRGQHGARQRRHLIAIEVFARRQQGLGGDGAAYVAVTGAVDTLIAYLEQYPRLGSGVTSLRTALPVETSEVFVSEASPFYMQRITVEAFEESIIDFKESAQ